MIDNEALHYLDNAATTRVAPEVADAIYKTMTNHWGNPSSLYTPGVESKELLDKARNIVGRTLGAEPGQVFFTGCGSESNNIALLGAALARRSWGKKIVASGFEHPSAALPLARLAEEGFEVDFVAPGADGRLDVDALADRVDKGTILVTCMQVNNETGARQDVKKLAARVKAANSRTAVHVDGVQAWMRLPVSLENIDSYTVSGHKIHAPKGVGALYLRRGYNIQPPYLGGGQEKGHGGGQEQGVRPGTENLPYAMGLAAAATRLAGSIRSRDKAMRALNDRLRAGLSIFPEVEINSPAGAVPEVLNFSENCIKSETMLAWLSEKQIYVSSASACGRGQPSHTLAAMGRDPLAIDTAIRVSFCADNTPEDVDAFLERFEDGMKHLQRIKK